MTRQNIRYLTDEQKKKLLKTLRDSKSAWRSYFMYSLMLSTGLRLSETLNLDVNGVHNGFKAREILTIKGKGDKIREIPLNTEIRRQIEGFVGQKKRKGEDIALTAPLFMSRNNRRITPRAVQLDFDKWITRADIDGKYSPHALRHTVGTELYKKSGGNIRLVQEILGHSFISTTQIYTHLTKDDMRQGVELLTV